MPRFLSRRGALAGAAAVVAGLSMGVAPASAASMSFTKSSGTIAWANWYEAGPLPGVEGNAHYGNLQIEDLGGGGANIFGNVDDFNCDPGETPDGGGHGGSPDGACDYLGTRFIAADQVTFTMDRKLTSATLTGTLTVYGGHDGQAVGNPAVNMTFTGIGSTTRSTNTFVLQDETGTYRYRYTQSGRQAQVTGNIGPMVFDDEPGEFSDAFIGNYRSTDRSRMG